MILNGPCLTMITQVWKRPAVIAFTQTFVPDAVTPRSSSAPTAKSRRARVPAGVPLASLARLQEGLPCRAEEALERISAGCFTAVEGEESARDKTCGDGELSSAQCVCVEHACPVARKYCCAAYWFVVQVKRITDVWRLRVRNRGHVFSYCRGVLKAQLQFLGSYIV